MTKDEQIKNTITMKPEFSDAEIELILSLCMDIGRRAQTLIKIYPKAEELQLLLRHFAASQIHIVMFIEDLVSHSDKFSQTDYESTIEFLKECGCNMKNIHEK
jgi:hypothetical protein